MVAITAMAGPFGAFVDDVDVSTSVDDATAQRLIDALHKHRILVIRGQQLSEAAYARFGAFWGDPILFFNPRDRHADLPGLIKIDNSPATPESMRDGAMHWHQDSSYEAVPASVTMLYAIEAPDDGNDTLFVDLVAAHDALPEDMRDRIDVLEVRHSPAGGAVALAGEKRGGGSGARGGLPDVTHPLVIRHPVTGRRALYGVSGTAVGIVGMDDGEAIDLLLHLKRHALQPQVSPAGTGRCRFGAHLGQLRGDALRHADGVQRRAGTASALVPHQHPRCRSGERPFRRLKPKSSGRR